MPSDDSTAPTTARVQLVLITGLSGSGKSSVAKCLEDLGYYCVDNLPVPLLRPFLEDPARHVEGVDRIAVVTDIRAPGLASQLPGLLATIDRQRVDPLLLFLSTSDEVLVRRYSETRRRHPLAPDGPVMEGIRNERRMLEDIRGMADRVLDTSGWTIHEVRAAVYDMFRPEGEATAMTVSLVSFGFKRGSPTGADLMFDVRFLPNPYFRPDLRKLTGLDPQVAEFLSESEEYGELIERLSDLLAYLLPQFAAENRSYLTVAIGCTGGQHRSVSVAERLAERLREVGWGVRVVHRDVERAAVHPGQTPGEDA